MSTLSQRMTDRMVYQNYSPRTVTSYVHRVRDLAVYYRRCPSELTTEEVQQYLLYLIRERKLAWSTVNVAAMAARYLYREVLGRTETQYKLPPRRYQWRLPKILGEEDTRRLIDAPRRLRDRAILQTIYGGGLRLGEVCRLKITDIDSAHMRIRIEQGKGRKDRYTMLPRRTLQTLRDYFRAERPENWLFGGRVPGTPISERAVQSVYHKACREAGITRTSSVHTLRHCFASHHLARGTDLLSIQKMMGHKHLSTTERYLHLMPERWGLLRSPVDA